LPSVPWGWRKRRTMDPLLVPVYAPSRLCHILLIVAQPRDDTLRNLAQADLRGKAVLASLDPSRLFIEPHVAALTRIIDWNGLPREEISQSACVRTLLVNDAIEGRPRVVRVVERAGEAA
jgi:hypothetical protein